MSASIRQSVLMTSLALLTLTSAVSAQTTVFMSGLANPRGLTFNGSTLYVSESGAGGTIPVFIGSDVELKAYGTTGRVSLKPIGGSQAVYLQGLPSVASIGGGGFSATGPQDVAFDNLGRLNITIGLGASPLVRQTSTLQNQALGSWLGTIVRREVAAPLAASFDVSALEAATDFDGAGRDSNPFGLGITSNGTRVVADAGGNTVTAIAPDNSTRTVVLPARPSPSFPVLGGPTYQAVPNGLTVGPDGNAYVVELTGFPFPPGTANIYKIELSAPTLTTQTIASGFTNLIDLAFGPAGTLYALEFDADSFLGPADTGRILQINPGGSPTVILDNLPSPTGLTVGPDGAFYIAATGLSPTDGQVLRYVVPEPAAAALLLPLATLGLRRRRA